MAEDIILVFGWGPEEAGRAASLLYIAETAEAMGLTVGIFLFTDGVVLAKRGVAERISESVGRRFSHALRSENIRVYVCEEAAKTRGLVDKDFEPGASIMGYAAFLDKSLEAKAVISV
ncbi:MAG: DsrE family protein [Candidatus Geothermarchaeales archaeon]